MTTLAIERALWRLSWKLRGSVEPGRRRAIRRELRAHLRTSAAEVGADEALGRLGPLDDLAREYADSERGGPLQPRMRSGVIAAVVVWALLVFADGRELLTRNGIEDRGSFDPWSWSFGAPNGKASLFTLSGDVEHGLLLDVQVHRLGYLLLPIVAFVLAARLWRAFGRPSLPLPRRRPTS
jgi:hypothetical protein